MKKANHNFKSIFILIVLTGILQASFGQEVILPSKGVCAHRGAMNTHPENTNVAFEEAIRLGAQMIELDVRLTKNKKLVILHDESVDRTTNGTGKIEDLTLKQVKKLDAGSWKSSDFKNLKIPTLSEALAIMPDNIWLNVHLKGDELLGKKVAKVIIKEKREHQAFLACGSEAAKGAKQVSPDILICNMERQTRTEDYVSLTIKSGSEFIQLYKVPVSPEIKHYTKTLKDNNIMVNYCCTDSPEEVKQLFEYGVDFVLVNELERILDAVSVPD
jgi:glycerophosphoryl diester phosphodiesterase